MGIIDLPLILGPLEALLASMDWGSIDEQERNDWVDAAVLIQKPNVDGAACVERAATPSIRTPAVNITPIASPTGRTRRGRRSIGKLLQKLQEFTLARDD